MHHSKGIILICASILIGSSALSNIHILKRNDLDVDNRSIENNSLEINDNSFSNEISSIEESENEDEIRENILNELRQIFGIKWNDQNRFDGRLAETPEYMTELYEFVTDIKTLPQITYPYSASAIRCFMELNISSTRSHFLFDINSGQMTYLRSTDILEAELRVYRLSINMESETFAPLITPPYLLLKVYQVTDIGSIETPDTQILLNVHCISYFNFGWQIFNIKSALQSWISGEKPNLGLLVVATTLFGNRMFVDLSRRDFQINTLQPVMILYERSTKDLEKQISQSDEESIDANKITTDKSFVFKCQRNDFHINFTTLGWSNFIVAPNGYNAYNCQGNCNYPVDLTTTTNHAAIQTLLNELKVEDAIPSCCVPRKVSPLNILYYVDLNVVLLKMFEQMIVDDCTCK